MNDEEKQQLTRTVATELDELRPWDIKPWLAGFTSTHPRELVNEVNLTLKEDPVFKDVVERFGAWHTEGILVSWSHVTPETEASLRDAASWRSASLNARKEWAKHGESMTWSHHFRRQGIPDRGNACRDASALWGGRVALNKAGVALRLHDSAPWPGEVAGVVKAVVPTQPWIVLCDGGQVLEGLPTWSRG